MSSLVWLSVRPAIVQIVSPQTFARWRVLWYVTTFAWFLAHSFWIYVGIMIMVLLVAGRREAHVFGLYLLLLLAAPPAAAPIPGLGILDHFFELNHYRLLALALLLPCAWRLALRGSTIRYFQSPVDWLVLAYLLVNAVLAFRGGNFTADTRAALMLWIDLFLPYYVASRSIQNTDGLRHALAGLVLGGLVLSVLAAVEVLRSWRLYDAATMALGLNPFSYYKMRGGFVRPSATIGESITLGYVIVVASGAYLYLQRCIVERRNRRLGWLLLSLGVLASLARAPWVGALLLLFVFVIVGPHPIKRMVQGGVISICIFFALSLVPMGQQFISLLPFVGDEEQGNVDYRASLLTVAIPVVERNLLFGSSDFLNAPELQVMRQGEGIIDVVNSYLGVALYAGLVGLFLFAGMFISALVSIRRGKRWALENNDTDGLVLGRAMFATVVAVIFIIFTMSSILAVPIIYFCIIGISCAYFLMQRSHHREKQKSQSV
ncbi:O-antigen ligase [Hydrogenophaga sp. IBVHS1]|uniref:O-antigen ligase family protein n=1 Tax=unclassified Hydrogenophaga TaxID=2610897 RepID=UPI001179B094|nr:O-antigen ligase family protein [Hydrogenophaga sp. IBVHS1]